VVPGQGRDACQCEAQYFGIPKFRETWLDKVILTMNCYLPNPFDSAHDSQQEGSSLSLPKLPTETLLRKG
jgi:hypothetical protein